MAEQKNDEVKSEDLEKLRNEIKNLELLNTYYSGSMPRNLFFSANINGSITAIDRDDELSKRDAMLRDAFVREMVKTIIVRALGSNPNSNKYFDLSIDDDIELEEQYDKLLKKEFDSIEKTVSKELLDMALQSQFYGDSYAKVIFEKNRGVVALQRNYSTNPFNITPIMTNRGDTMAYEVSLDSYKFTNAKTKSFSNGSILNLKNSRYYVAPINIARINAKGNATDVITTSQYATLDNMNIFAEDERVYEDSVYGGIVEGVYEYYVNYKFALTSLANTRIASSVVERFVIHNLQGVGDTEKRLLKQALEKQLKDTLDAVAKKTTNKDPHLMVANHLIPTTGDGTNSVSIQESNLAPSGFQNVEDILTHIKAFVGAMGYSYQMTAFSDGQTGGREREQYADSSFTLDNRANEIRNSVTEMILSVVKTHFLAKFNLDIDTSIIKVRYQSIVNRDKIEQESRRVEAISNSQMVLSIIEQYRNMKLEDNELNRKMLISSVKDLVPQDTENFDEMVEAYVNIILTPPPQEEGMGGTSF
jgi:hypothetical protein